MQDKIFTMMFGARRSAASSLLTRGAESVDVGRILLRILAILGARLLARGREAGGRVIGAKFAPGTVADDQFIREIHSVSAAEVNIANMAPAAHC